MSGARFGGYIHSDSTTPHKGAALALVSGQDADTFADRAARMAYASSADTWAMVAETFPDIEATREEIDIRVHALGVLRLESGEAGRIDLAFNEVAGLGCVAKVLCSTDFGARTEVFHAFVADVAGACVRHANRHWGTLVAFEPTLEAHRSALARELGERVEVVQLVLLDAGIMGVMHTAGRRHEEMPK
jgi:hypothetical protein